MRQARGIIIRVSRVRVPPPAWRQQVKRSVTAPSFRSSRRSDVTAFFGYFPRLFALGVRLAAVVAPDPRFVCRLPDPQGFQSVFAGGEAVFDAFAGIDEVG